MGKAIFRFRGRFEKRGDEIWAVCDHAPVYVSGDSEESALSEVAEAVADYVDVLFQRDEIDEAVAAGLLVKVRGGRVVRCAKRETGGRFVAVVAHVA